MTYELLDCRTNGLCDQSGTILTKGIHFVLRYVESDKNSKGSPDHFEISVNGGKFRQLGFASNLPDGSMSILAALCLWGKYSKNRDKCLELANSIISMWQMEVKKI